jgi:Bax protein
LLQPASPTSLAIIVIAFLLAFGGTVWFLRYEPLPDFGVLDVPTKKERFFAFLEPKVQSANNAIESDRRRLEEIGKSIGKESLSWFERRFIAELATDYNIDRAEPADYAVTVSQLRKRVDVIPTSLVLIQAAKESGWGTSKFAMLGNNLFGQQCFVAGCGIVPVARTAGRQHEVARFTSVDQAVASYLHNLNTHPRYQRLREIRAMQRVALGEYADLTGTELADGLLAYSERGADYVTEVKAMIRQNRLE